MQKNTYSKINEKWDYIIITANNYRQKELAEKKAEYILHHFLLHCQNTLADPVED